MIIAVGDILAFKVVCRQGQQEGINDFTYRVTTGNANDIPGAVMADEFFGKPQSTYPPILTNSAVLSYVTFARIWPTLTPQSYSAAVPVVGSAGANPLPSQTSGLITRYTNQPRQAGRGRIFPPFPDDSFVQDGVTTTPGYVALLNAIATQLMGSLHLVPGGNAIDMFAVLRQSKTAPNTWPTVASFRSRSFFVSQRRRSALGKANVF